MEGTCLQVAARGGLQKSVLPFLWLVLGMELRSVIRHGSRGLYLLSLLTSPHSQLSVDYLNSSFLLLFGVVFTRAKEALHH